MRLSLQLNTDKFAETLSEEILAGGLSLVDAIERILEDHLETSVLNLFGNRLIKVPRSVVHPFYYKNRFENLSGLREHGYQTWYPEVLFSTRKEDDLVIEEVETVGFNLGLIQYGHGIELAHQYARKELKTQINHRVRLNEVKLPSEIFTETTKKIETKSPLKQPFIANLCVGPQLNGFRVVSFDHVLTGERRFCRCHLGAHQEMLNDARKRVSSYAPGSWPHGVIELLEGAVYEDSICHFCVASSHGEESLIDWYGDQIQTYFDPYVDLLIRGEKMDPRTADAEAKRRLALSRWVREAELYRLVSKLFQSQKILREASPTWLGRQRLDIYLPELSLALEYQGEQHFRPIEVFGGAEAFAKNRERDERKRVLCKENGVTIVDIRFDESLTLGSLRLRLQRWLSD